jgi:hypothetical protein
VTEGGVVTVDTAFARDDRIGPAACGLLLRMLTRLPGDTHDVDDVIRLCARGDRREVVAALRELQAIGCTEVFPAPANAWRRWKFRVRVLPAARELIRTPVKRR